MESKRQDILQSSFLFCGLPTSLLQELAQKSKIHTYSTGQIIIEEHLTNDKIFLILEGLVKVYKITEDGKEIFLALEKSNDYLGTMDLDDKPATATIEALCPTTAIMLSKKDLATTLSHFPLLWQNMYKITLAKLRDLNKLHSIRLGHDLCARTYLLLQYLAKFSQNNTVLLSQEILASIVGATRPRVTEVLQKLQKENKILIFPKKIIFLPQN